MPIPSNFQFSQGSLQDYVDCPKRFYLRYIRRLAWPAVEAEPALENERLIHQGERFHALIYQSLLGIPNERLDRMVQDADLSVWWRNFQSALPDLKSNTAGLYPEVSLTAVLGGYILTARCDLVIKRDDGRVQIFDWKTSQSRMSRERLAARLQTRVYPYLLIRDGARLNGGQSLQPEQVEMIYWFTRYPEQPERFVYKTAQFLADEDRLKDLISGIADLDDAGFTPGPQNGQSKYCVYRSFCEHGVRAGNLSERKEEEDGIDALDVLNLDFDFEQIAEVEY